MAVNYVIKGYIKDGELHIDLPQDVRDAEVVMQVTVIDDYNDTPLSDEEITGLLKSEPLTGAEIVAQGLTGGWKELGITDSVAWVEEQKRKRRERHKWQEG